MSRNHLARLPLRPLFARTGCGAGAARPAAAMRAFGLSSTAPRAAPPARTPRPPAVALPSKIALDSFFVQHAPLSEQSLAAAHRHAAASQPAPQKPQPNRDIYMDQLASMFGGFVPFRTPAPPPEDASNWQRMTLRGGEERTVPEAAAAEEQVVAEEAQAAEEEELRLAREVIQAARLWANIKKIRHQKIKKHKLRKLRKRDRIQNRNLGKK
ncbi:hypothetical protein DFJ74DRAFT_691563 [Hyaloraphidium curvatum]|nr:hypothetical protein DFJ74DRAFT_691563 [Hyaloraphidium curvatum]